MAQKTLYLLGILLTIIIGSIVYYNHCSSCRTAAAGTADSTANIPLPPLNGLKLTADSLNYQCTHNFDFLTTGFATLLPVSDSVNIGLDALKAYLAKNTNAKVLITSYAKSDEKNTSAYTNLGEARAVDIENYIVARGIPRKVFDTKGEIIDTWRLRGDTVLGPVNFTITKNDTAKAIDWNALKAKINADPLILYFETAQSEITLTAQERQKVSDIVRYLGHVETGTIIIVGYTDNAGTKDANIQLGQARADFTKNYFIKNGIETNKINTSSKGESDPAADNNTPEGKAKNRRTIVTIN
jgi:outer membrane protein OmpA-like peptidoglycan-associated protein